MAQVVSNKRTKYRKYVDKYDRTWAVYEIVPRNKDGLNEKIICQSKIGEYPEWSDYQPCYRENYDITYISKEELANLKVAAL